MKRIRCAIYTRKSSEEGLEQAFNSLDAQREACAAYVLSQASEGWTLLPDVYDDGGLSGGSLDRPALQRLLADVGSGLIDIIVVYKVDRLTRSLLDFAKLVEAFDKVGTSFVSVTQSFNTTTSMGRLTLNMLLSFAQFEREVTAERIRDKIAASKAKGMWMGGNPPLGYQPSGRTLAIVEEHAAIVRDIYRRYLELGNVRLLAEQLVREGIRSPVRASSTGRSYGGGHFTRGQLYFMLKNPIYVGDIAHRGQTHAGQHPAIIDREQWQQVQALLAQHLKGNRRTTSSNPSALAGLIVDAAGEPLLAVHSCKGKVRYRYYVSRVLHHGGAGGTRSGIRLSAREIEAAVAEQIAALFDDPVTLAARMGVTITPALLREINPRCAAVADNVRQRSRRHFPDLLAQVRVIGDRLEIDVKVCKAAELLEIEGADEAATVLTLSTAVRLTRTGHVVRLIQKDGSALVTSEADTTLISLLVKARRWWGLLAEGQSDTTTIARQEGVSRSYLTRVVRLAFLAPAVIDAILEGRQRATIDGEVLTATDAIPASWTAQTVRFLPAQKSH
jgi:site-specific DNA recombinase